MRRIKRRQRQYPFPYSHFIRFSTNTFIHRGYTRTRLDYLAEGSLVAKGTIYLYVRSKLALFYQCLRMADRRGALGAPRKRPVPTPSPEMLRGYANHLLEQARRLPKLDVEAPARTVRETRRELAAALDEIYRNLDENRTAVRLIERCSADCPPIAKLGLDIGHMPAIALVTRFLEAHRCYLPRPKDPAVFARVMVEILAFIAIYREDFIYPMTPGQLRGALGTILTRAVIRPRRASPPARPGASTPAPAPAGRIDPPPGGCQT